MKKNIYYILAIILILVSCKKVFDVNPTDAISSDIAFTDSVSVEKVLIGSYNALQAVGLYGRNQVIIGDLAADNLTWTGTSLDYGQIENKPIPAENGIVDGMWSSAYDGINRVNNILYRLPSIGYKSEKGRQSVAGEALFIRALLHFYLATYFGGIPLKIEPTLDLTKIDMARSPLTEVYQQLITDLNSAREILPKTSATGRVNAFGASSLLAKVYLANFHLTNDAASSDSAIVIAGRVISEGGYALSPYGSLFDPTKVSDESIFEIIYDLQNYNRLAQYFYSRDSSGRYEIAPTDAFIQSFDTNDVRLDFTITYDGKNKPYVIKYNDVSGGTDRVYVFRLAEMYLIRAEAQAYSNGDIESIQSDLNMIRVRAGLDSTQAATIPDLKLAIENECRLEFAFEGHRWPDLVRTKRAATLLGIDEKYTLFPIPLSEKQTNNLIEQNPGY